MIYDEQATLTGMSLQGFLYRDVYPCWVIPVGIGSTFSCCLRFIMKMLVAVVILLIMLDATLTYLAVGHLGAHEAVLLFVNQVPALMWLVAFVKVLGVLYLVEKAKKYAWIKYGLLFIIVMHAAAVVNDVYWLLWRLSFL